MSSARTMPTYSPLTSRISTTAVGLPSTSLIVFQRPAGVTWACAAWSARSRTDSQDNEHPAGLPSEYGHGRNGSVVVVDGCAMKTDDTLRSERSPPPVLAPPIMDTLATIKELAAKQFGGEPDTIDESAQVDQLGIDSLGFLEFLFELEDKFSFPIPQESVANVRTLRELATAIDGLIAARSPAPT